MPLRILHDLPFKQQGRRLSNNKGRKSRNSMNRKSKGNNKGNSNNSSENNWQVPFLVKKVSKRTCPMFEIGPLVLYRFLLERTAGLYRFR